MAKTHMKRHSASLVYNEIQVKTTVRYHYSPTRMAKTNNRKKEKQQVSSWIWNNWDSHMLLVGIRIKKINLGQLFGSMYYS